MRFLPRFQKALIVGLTLLPSSCILTREDVQGPVVQRPTFSSNTATEAEGNLSMEFGAELGPSSRSSVPLAFRWGVAQGTEFVVGGDVYKRNLGGPSGMGDLLLGARHRVREMGDDSSAITFGWYTSLPTASKSRGLGSGELDFGVSLARDHMRGTSTITQYYQLDLLGEPDGQGLNMGHLAAIAMSRPMGGDLGVVGEFSGGLVPERNYTAMHALLAVTYTPSSWTVVDLGLRLGFGDDGEDWTVLVGFGRSLGRMMAR
jgi:hypothetical protein